MIYAKTVICLIGQMAEAFSTLTEAYSATTSYMIPKNYSQLGDIAKGKATAEKNIVIHWPAITTLGIGTPGQIFDNLSTGEIEDGFLNRQVVIQASEPLAEAQFIKNDNQIDEILTRRGKEIIPGGRVDIVVCEIDDRRQLAK